jgi:hypothetical protein
MGQPFGIASRTFYKAPAGGAVASPQAQAQILATNTGGPVGGPGPVGPGAFVHFRPGITGAQAAAQGGTPLSKAAAQQIVATPASYSTAAHSRPQIQAQQLAQITALATAQANAGIRSRSFSTPVPATQVNAVQAPAPRGRRGGVQII